MPPISALPNHSILVVVTSHAALGSTGRDTGYYLSEVAHPHRVFSDAGYVMDYASPNGALAPMDKSSFDLSDPVISSFWRGPGERALANTIPLRHVRPELYSAVFFAGGHGTMWDFNGNKDIAKIARSIFERGGVVAAVCHGPAALVDVQLSDGSYLVGGREVTSFTNAEETAAQLHEIVPFALETALRDRGARFVEGGLWQNNVAGRGTQLITGQNPMSAVSTAEAVVEKLRK
ncbi:MAG: type 1 glutamine amidotransferase domain-containing protein [Deltaproteobacteria bacterium]|nr:type 1 glutamine amidotransferase domain-containing protein [Deltaproteobacteria bacterium]